MANIYKTFLSNDITSTQTLLHESLPLTGTIVSGTYADNNIKNYSHAMFQSVYDYPYLSSSANKIFDLSFGWSVNSNKSSSAYPANAKKIRMYNTMAKQLVGHDATGTINEFDRDGDPTTTTDKMREVFFINYSRLLYKDEIKKGSFRLQFLTGGASSAPPESSLSTVGDYGAATSYRVNSPVGEYGILYSSSTSAANRALGLVYYQAGIAVLTASLFSASINNALTRDFLATSSVNVAMTGSTIEEMCNGLRNRWYDCDFNNTVELNSSIYYCRVNHNDYNYSSNQTYLSASKMVCKNSSKDHPVSYITGIGLYSADNKLLASAKLSEPLKNTPENELTLRVRLDY